MLMKQVTIHEAKTHLSRLIREALAGEEVIIAKGHDPLVKITPLKKPNESRRIGGLQSVILEIASDFDASLADFEEHSR